MIQLSSLSEKTQISQLHENIQFTNNEYPTIQFTHKMDVNADGQCFMRSIAM